MGAAQHYFGNHQGILKEETYFTEKKKETLYIKSRGELFPTGENIKKLQTISWQAEDGIAGIYSIWQ